MDIREDILPVLSPLGGIEESNALRKTFESGWWGKGPKVAEFERSFAEMVGAKYAVATVNGTAALQVALRLAGVKVDDEVIIPSLTFIAPVNAIKYNGAYPVFMDSDKYYNIDLSDTREDKGRDSYYCDSCSIC